MNPCGLSSLVIRMIILEIEIGGHQPASLKGLENKKSAVFPSFSHVLSAPIIIHPIKSLKIDQNTI